MVLKIHSLLINIIDTHTVDSFKLGGGLLIPGDVISWMLWFSVSVRKAALCKFVFIDDVNL